MTAGRRVVADPISDLVGRVQIPVEELMKKPNEMHRREDSLMGFEDANDMPGEYRYRARGVSSSYR